MFVNGTPTSFVGSAIFLGRTLFTSTNGSFSRISRRQPVIARAQSNATAMMVLTLVGCWGPSSVQRDRKLSDRVPILHRRRTVEEQQRLSRCKLQMRPKRSATISKAYRPPFVKPRHHQQHRGDDDRRHRQRHPVNSFAVSPHRWRRNRQTRIHDDARDDLPQIPRSSSG